MELSLIFDVFVCILLMATIGYAVVLNRRLTVIQNSREELQRILSHFSESLSRAEEGIRELRKVANLVGSDLNAEIKKGSGLRDDLAYLIERGDSLANQLEERVRQARGAGGSTGGSKGVDAPAPSPALSPVRDEGERLKIVPTLGGQSFPGEAYAPDESLGSSAEAKRELTPKEQKILKALTGLR